MTNEEFLKSISLEGEIWKPVVEYEGRYMVSSHGRIIGCLRRKRILKQRINELYKYPTVVLRDDLGKYHSVFVHRIVATCFIPNDDNKPCIDHIDTNRLNCHASNLRWVTSSENLRNPITRAKRIGKKHNLISPNRRKIVALQKGEIALEFDFINQAKTYGFCNAGIIRSCQHPTRIYKGYNWMYRDDYENLSASDVKELLK